MGSSGGLEGLQKRLRAFHDRLRPVKNQTVLNGASCASHLAL